MSRSSVRSLVSIREHFDSGTIALNTYVRRQDDRRRRLIQIADVEWLALHADIGRNQRVQPLGGLRNRLRRLRRLSSHSHLRELLGHALYAGLDRCGLLRVSRVGRVVARLAVCCRLAICRLLRRRWVYVTRLTVCWLLRHTVGRLLCLLTWVSKCACGCGRWLTAWRGGGSQTSICARAKVECLSGVCSLLLATSCGCSSLLLCAILLLAVLLAVLVRVGHVEVGNCPRAWLAATRDLCRRFC